MTVIMLISYLESSQPTYRTQHETQAPTEGTPIDQQRISQVSWTQRARSQRQRRFPWACTQRT